MNGQFTTRTKRIVIDRQDGACAICQRLIIETVGYGPLRDYEFHHRLPRRAGGRRGHMARLVASPANCLLLCSPCHDGIERGSRTYALSRGWLIPDSRDIDPSLVDVWHLGVWVRLTDSGSVAVGDYPRGAA